jgi:hypothetical protein
VAPSAGAGGECRKTSPPITISPLVSNQNFRALTKNHRGTGKPFTQFFRFFALPFREKRPASREKTPISKLTVFSDCVSVANQSARVKGYCARKGSRIGSLPFSWAVGPDLCPCGGSENGQDPVARPGKFGCRSGQWTGTEPLLILKSVWPTAHEKGSWIDPTTTVSRGFGQVHIPKRGTVLQHRITHI